MMTWGAMYRCNMKSISENDLRRALGNALNRYIKDITPISSDAHVIKKLHRLGLKLINYVLAELGIDKQDTINKMRNTDGRKRQVR